MEDKWQEFMMRVFATAALCSVAIVCVPARTRGESHSPEAIRSLDNSDPASSPDNCDGAALIDGLRKKLDAWGDLSTSETKELLREVAHCQITAARDIVVQYTQLDSSRSDEVILIREAIRALGTIDRDGAVEVLSSMTEDRSDDVAATVAVVLGEVGDKRAVQLLSRLAQHSSPTVQARAISSLAKYCQLPTTTGIVPALSSSDTGIRVSAAYWLSQCAASEDAYRLVPCLADAAPLVRTHALRGLLRLGSPLGCSQCGALQVHESSSVQSAARRYCAEICGSNEVDGPSRDNGR